MNRLSSHRLLHASSPRWRALAALILLAVPGCSTQTSPTQPIVSLRPTLTSLPANAPETNPLPNERRPANVWSANDAALDIIKQSEGLRLEAYYYMSQWLIGYGHARDVTSGMTISEERADELLRRDIREAENGVADAVTVPVTQNEFSAMVSLCFNIGPQRFAESVLVKRLNKSDYKGAADAFRYWSSGTENGVKVALSQLIERRSRERSLFLNTGSTVEDRLAAAR